MNPHLNELTHEIVGAAIEVHRYLGPGLLESAYQECLCHELRLRGVDFRRELNLTLQGNQARLRLSCRCFGCGSRACGAESNSNTDCGSRSAIANLSSPWGMESWLTNQLQCSGVEGRNT